MSEMGICEQLVAAKSGAKVYPLWRNCRLIARGLHETLRLYQSPPSRCVID